MSTPRTAAGRMVASRRRAGLVAFDEDILAIESEAAALDRDTLWRAAEHLSRLVDERHPGHVGDVIAPADVQAALEGREP